MRLVVGDTFLIDGLIATVQEITPDIVTLTVHPQAAWPFPTWIRKTKFELKKCERYRPAKEPPTHEEAPF
jgi:hypothetical protein